MGTNRKGPNLSGQEFGRLKVLSEVPANRFGHRQWLCLCDCGQQTTVVQNAMKSGRVASCGCLRIEVSKARQTTHGHTSKGRRSPEHRAWHNMRARCEMPSSSHFAAYGGRGIKVCAGWHSFADFIKDMGFRPSAKHSIDRVDNTRGYDCGGCRDCLARGAAANCRWATPVEQVNNRSNTHFVDYDGRRTPLAVFAREHQVNYWMLRKRLLSGMSPRAALASTRAAGGVR
jgi:hypothetical protein